MENKKASLLVVEDDAFIRNSMTAYLKAEGFLVDKVENGRGALERINKKPPDLIITDLKMPEMGGMELLQKVEADFPAIPVIIVSGVGTMELVIEALRMGAKDYLQKPIHDMGLLKHSIDGVLSHTSLKEENRKYQEELEDLVEKRTAELWHKNLVLQRLIKEREEAEAQLLHAQKLESVGQLAAGIAHEINTPTQFVSSNIDFLTEAFAHIKLVLEDFRKSFAQDRIDSLTRDDLQKLGQRLEDLDWPYLAEEIPMALGQSTEGVTRISTIVGAMKEFSHPGSKSAVDIDLNHVINTTVNVARNEWKYVADLRTELDPNLKSTSCHSDEISQVLLNIIVNAAHAIEDRLGDNPEEKKGNIVISSQQLENYAEITISDDGSGIPSKVKHRIFDPFFTTKKVGKGTGQGLAIAHNVVTKKHEGEIFFTSQEGNGTVFTVRLPQHI